MGTLTCLSHPVLRQAYTATAIRSITSAKASLRRNRMGHSPGSQVMLALVNAGS